MAEASDLSLVDQLELRLAGCGTTEQLQACTSSFLVPLLHKLSTTPHSSVKQRALQILVHWSRRLRAEDKVPLPASSLLDLLHGEGGYEAPVTGQALPLLLMFLQLAIPRLQDDSVSIDNPAPSPPFPNHHPWLLPIVSHLTYLLTHDPSGLMAYLLDHVYLSTKIGLEGIGAWGSSAKTPFLLHHPHSCHIPFYYWERSASCTAQSDHCSSS